MTAVALFLGLLIDHFVGEAKRWHPSVGFGNAASRLEYEEHSPCTQRLGETALLVRLLCSVREGLQRGFQSTSHSMKADEAALRCGLPSFSQQQEVIDRMTTHNWRPL